jgi:hypothetical protein
MTRKLSALAIMACLASSLAFASEKCKPAPSAEDAKAEATQTVTADNNQQDGRRSSSAGRDKSNRKHEAKPAPTEQEREFDRVLRGIYG